MTATREGGLGGSSGDSGSPRNHLTRRPLVGVRSGCRKMSDEAASLSLRPPAKGAPRIVAVGGGRGGVGKSVVTLNLGVYLAQLGRNVIVADVDPGGATIHAMLGTQLPQNRSDAPDAAKKGSFTPLPTPIPGLHLMPASRDAGGLGPIKLGKKSGWLNRLSDLPADYVLLDLGSGVSPAALDLFLSADVGLCVAVPEPPAIELTYQFLRAAFLRKLRRSLAKERFKLRLVERAIEELSILPSPLEVIDAIGRYDTAIAALADAHLATLHPGLVVCQTRVRSDLDLGPAMRAMAGRYLGVDLDYIGYVEQDDAVWLTVRRRRPLLIDSPASKSARNVERIARRVLALLTVHETRPAENRAPRNTSPLTLYEALGMPRGASDEDVRRAVKRQREIYAEGSLPLTSLLFGDDLTREQARVEEAHDTLLDPVRRRAYDLSTFPESEAAPEPSAGPESQGAADELLMLQAELAREIHTETEFTGALLRKVRESQGIDLAQIANKTKITPAYLSSIEQEAYGELPALVYTRGFLQELAKCLNLDPSHVARTYLRRMRDALATSGRGNP
jgi:flagellar biosynthesis protein FlhG